MPIYAFQLDDGSIEETLLPVRLCPPLGARRKLRSGRTGTRILESPGQSREVSGEFWRRHHSPGLAIGKHEVGKFEDHYARSGIHVDHRQTPCGDYEPVIRSKAQWDAMLRARGLKDFG